MINKPCQRLALSGAVLCLLAVLIGAFGAHALGDLLTNNQRNHIYELANRYQFYHGLALIMIGALFAQVELPNRLNLVLILMLSGTVLFSGSLYLLAIFNIPWLGALTPIGGILLLLAWMTLVISIVGLRHKA